MMERVSHRLRLERAVDGRFVRTLNVLTLVFYPEFLSSSASIN